MATETVKTRTIKVTQSFHTWLTRQGYKGEDYEDILKRLIDLKNVDKKESAPPSYAHKI